MRRFVLQSAIPGSRRNGVFIGFMVTRGVFLEIAEDEERQEASDLRDRLLYGGLPADLLEHQRLVERGMEKSVG